MSAPKQKSTASCIHTALLQRTARDAHRDILMDEGESITGAELSRRVELAASHLIARGTTGKTIGILMDNTIGHVVAYFACLQAGAVVATLPRGTPATVSPIIADGHISILLTDQADTSSWQSPVSVLHMDALQLPAETSRAPATDPNRPAHLLFTSGTSTGRPRRVFTDHVGSVLSHAWRTSLWPYAAHEVVGCNIFGLWDVVPALHSGVPAVLLSDRILRDPLRLSTAIRSYAITRIMLTPTLVDACLRCPEAVTALSGLRLLVLCGEGISRSLHSRIAESLPCVRVVNLYSLSECHDVAAGDLPPPGEAIRLRIAPFAEVCISHGQERDKVLPDGTAGRILVGGPGLAQPDRKEDAKQNGFFTLPAKGSEDRKVFDTGDRGAISPDGWLEVLGRYGSNVKIRGTWVVPSDVETMLQRYAGIAQACVTTTANEMGHPSLQAHIVIEKSDQSFELDALYEWLRQRMHPAAVPGRIVLRETLPLLASGKIDRRRLDEPLVEASGQSPAVGERSMTEIVAEAFQKVLGQTDITSADRFDHVGGDSLALVALCAEIQDRTGHRMTLADLKPNDSPASLAARLSPLAAVERSPVPSQSPQLSPLPVALKKTLRSHRTILITGATGGLGRPVLDLFTETPGIEILALVRSENHPLPAVARRVLGDLALPRFGWSQTAYDELATEIDCVLHIAANTDMLASYADLQQVNVAGTEALIQLAARAGAAFIMVSSSAVFPLHFGTSWAESFHGFTRLNKLRASLIASGADGYSLTKHDAELLAWQAHERGMPVHVIRIPHVLTPNHPSRLSHVAKAWAKSGIIPEAPWQWQFIKAEAVAKALVLIAAEPQTQACLVTHIAYPPVDAKAVQEAMDYLGHKTHSKTMPAAAKALSREGTLAPLISRYSPAAAMCVNEPILEAPAMAGSDSTECLRHHLLLISDSDKDSTLPEA